MGEIFLGEIFHGRNFLVLNVLFGVFREKFFMGGIFPGRNFLWVESFFGETFLGGIFYFSCFKHPWCLDYALCSVQCASTVH